MAKRSYCCIRASGQCHRHNSMSLWNSGCTGLAKMGTERDMGRVMLKDAYRKAGCHCLLRR